MAANRQDFLETFLAKIRITRTRAMKRTASLKRLSMFSSSSLISEAWALVNPSSSASKRIEKLGEAAFTLGDNIKVVSFSVSSSSSCSPSSGSIKSGGKSVSVSSGSSRDLPSLSIASSSSREDSVCRGMQSSTLRW